MKFKPLAQGHGLCRTLAVAAALTVLSAQPALAVKGEHPNGKNLATITIEFAGDCKSASISSTKDIGDVVAIMSNGSWEKFEDIPDTPTLDLQIDPDGPNAGETFMKIYVKSGVFKQRDDLGIVPGAVGWGEVCPEPDA